MRGAFTMRFRPDVAAFVQSQANACKCRVTNSGERCGCQKSPTAMKAKAD